MTNSNTESDVELYIDHFGSSVIAKYNEITLDATVNDFNITFKLDTGAQSNIIPIATFNKIKNNLKLLKTNTTLKADGGHNIDIVGKCNMTLSLRKKNLTCEFFIVNTKYTKPLLGLETCQDLSVINVHHITIKPEIDSLIKEYADVFKGLGKIEGEYHINLHQNAKPVIHPRRKVPTTILPKLKEIFNKLIRANVINKI